MKLYGSLTSPFVRAVRIAAIELGLDAEIEFAPTVVRPTQPNRNYGAEVNPFRRVPALEMNDGAVIIDSKVIIDYFDIADEGRRHPGRTEGAHRRLQSPRRDGGRDREPRLRHV